MLDPLALTHLALTQARTKGIELSTGVLCTKSVPGVLKNYVSNFAMGREEWGLVIITYSCCCTYRALLYIYSSQPLACAESTNKAC